MMDSETLIRVVGDALLALAQVSGHDPLCGARCTCGIMPEQADALNGAWRVLRMLRGQALAGAPR